MTPVISVSHLGKRYGATVAVDDVSLEVFEGEIFGLIGPNGAGKTTTMECVQGHRHPDRGTISVLGLDPRRDATALRQRIGVQHQEAQLQKRIKVWEAVDLWSSLYSHVVDTDALLARLGLEAKRNAWFMTLSGGQKQRLFIALALIHEPELVFLDELTTGLDPQARRAIWELDREHPDARHDGLPHDAPDGRGRAALRPRGHHRARPTRSKSARRPRWCASTARSTPSCSRATPPTSPSGCGGLPAVRSATSSGATHTIRGEGDDFVTDVIHLIAREGIHVRGFRTEIPTLEDVFLKLTGHDSQGLSDADGTLETDAGSRPRSSCASRWGSLGTIGMPVVLFVVLGRMLRVGARRPPAAARAVQRRDPGRAPHRARQRAVARRDHRHLPRGRHSQAAPRHAAVAGHDSQRPGRREARVRAGEPRRCSCWRASGSFPA